MKRNKNRLIAAIRLLPIERKCLLMLFLTIFALIGNLDAQTPQIWPTEISFNYEGGSSNDAVTIRKNASTSISVPEYVKDSRNESCAYIISQSSHKIKVKFNSNNSNMNYLVKATVISGTGIGNVCEIFVAPCDLNKVLTVDLAGSIPSSVSKRTFTWKWEATALPINSPYCPITCTSFNTTHTFYSLLATPQAPVTEPWTNILDYACDWASGQNNANSVCTAILSNGFNAHYTWNMDCHRLASDFVCLVSSLGISATLHRWASQNYYIGDMAYQRTKSIDPVGSTWGQGTIEWSWHQWAEAVSAQRDPSANTSKTGNWGTYEDDLFTHYKELISSSPYSRWVSNQPGQSSGCEAPTHRLYYNYPSSNIFYDWRGPDR